MTIYNRYYDRNAAFTAIDIVNSFYESCSPVPIPRNEKKNYVISHDANGYMLKYQETEDAEATIIATEQDLADFIIAVFKVWTGKTYNVEDIFGSEKVTDTIKEKINPCTVYWNFMMDTYALFENTGFDTEKARPLVAEQIKMLQSATKRIPYISSVLLQYTVEHFIRYAHDTDNMRYLTTMSSLADFVLKNNVQDFIDMITSYPDMDEIKHEYIAEALSMLKEYMSYIIAPSDEIHQDAHAHLQMVYENEKFLHLLFNDARQWVGIINCVTPYTERNRRFTSVLPDSLPGNMASDRFCTMIDKLLQLNKYITHKSIYYSRPARWQWNEDKTKILDVGSRAAFDPLFFGPDSKEWKEADEALNGPVWEPLPEDYRHKCDFSSNAMITTGYIIGYPELYNNEHMARITISQTYQARDGFCSRYVSVETQDIRERLDEKRVCFVTKEVLKNGFDVKTCNRDFNPEKPYDSGWMFFGDIYDNDYINNPDNIEMVDLKSFLEICPKAVSLMEEFNKEVTYERHEALITDKDGNQTEYTHEETIMSFPMNNKDM